MSRRLVILFAVLAAAAVGLSIYAMHLHRRVAREAQSAVEQQVAVAPAGNGPPETITLYVADDSDASVRKTQVSVVLPAERSERDRAILRTLMAQYLAAGTPHPVGAGSDIRQVYLMGEDTAVVDTNSAFADAHPAGVLAEKLTIASLVATLNANDNKIERVKILVNGQERDTLAGHADLRRFYEAGSIGQAELSWPRELGAPARGRTGRE
ncbi:MAG TPA: GerMN domain-containing protein [Terriglobales bacterium]|nr:GerMN domain-containing protein [Terriglobales bacterium]